MSFPENNRAESSAYKMSLHFYNPGCGKSTVYIYFLVRFVKYESSRETEILLSPKACILSENSLQCQKVSADLS